MNVIEFKFSKFIDDPFRINENIEPIYLDISEMVFSKIYKAYCFNPLFEGVGEIEEKQAGFKSAIIEWADCFAEWGINDIERAREAVNDLIYTGIYPSVGLFRAFYFNDDILIEQNIYREYINYLHKFCFMGKDGKIHGADYFNDWGKERTNANKDIG